MRWVNEILEKKVKKRNKLQEENFKKEVFIEILRNVRIYKEVVQELEEREK